MSTDSTVLGVPGTETFEGATAEAAVAAARAKHGDTVRIGEPTRTLVGGFGGFFAKERWTVQVALGQSGVEPVAGSVEDAEALLGAVPSGPASLVTYTQALAARPATGVAAPAPAPANPFVQALAAVESDSTVAAAVQRTVGPGMPAEQVDDGGLTVFRVTSPAALPARMGEALSGVNPALLGEPFAADRAANGDAAAITALFATHYRHPGVPVLDTGEVIIVVGIGADAVEAAQTIAGSVGVSPSSVHAAGTSAAVSLVPANRRIRNVADAKAVVAKAHKAPLVVAIDTGWGGPDDNLVQVLATLSPVETWAVVDATRRTQDLTRWLGTLGPVSGLIVENAEHTSAPTQVLTLGSPVVYLDGRPATPKRWAAVITTGALA